MPLSISLRRTFLALVAAAALVLPSAKAAQVNYGDLGNFILDPDLSLADIGSLVRLGTFTPGFDFGANSTDFAATNSAFTEFDTTAIGAAPGSGAGQFYDTVVLASNLANTQLYIWVLNNGVAASANAWVIVTNPSWLVPPDPTVGTASIDIDTSDPGTIIPPGARGFTDENLNSANLVDFAMQPIPEPSTYALVIIGSLAVLGWQRSRAS